MIRGSSGVLDPVEQVEIVLRTAAGDHKHAADGRVRGADRTGALRGVVDGGGIERHQLVIGAAVQGKLFHLLLIDEAGALLCRDIDAGGCVFNCDLLLDGADGQGKIGVDRGADGDGDAGAREWSEAVGGDGDAVAANGDGGSGVAAGGVGVQACARCRSPRYAARRPRWGWQRQPCR